MAVNLRLSPEAAEAVRIAAQRSGRSQQEVIREAIARYVGLVAHDAGRRELDQLVSTGNVRPPRTPARVFGERLKLPAGISSADLLDRGDRI